MIILSDKHSFSHPQLFQLYVGTPLGGHGQHDVTNTDEIKCPI